MIAQVIFGISKELQKLREIIATWFDLKFQNNGQKVVLGTIGVIHTRTSIIWWKMT